MLKIGDFARLGQVSVRMLRHYDAVGLLQPAAVDPWSGYRSYTSDQIARLNRLVALKELGFTLQQVRDLLDADDPALLPAMLRLRHEQLAAELAQSQRRLVDVERRLRLMEREGTMSNYEFRTKELPALRLADVGEHVDSLTDVPAVMGRLYGRLIPALQAVGGINGPSVSWYEMDADGPGMTVHAAWPYGGEPTGGFDIVELPAEPLAAAGTFVGPLAQIGIAWQQMAQWWAEEGLEPSGPCRELTLAEPPTDPGGDWVVELQQPVRPGTRT